MTSAFDDRAKWALLIGINEYPKFAPRGQLTGCVNDVQAMRQVLTGPFGFPEDHITVLTDGQATQDAIRGAMKALVQRVGNGDIVVFHYSGHGSQMTDLEGDEPDGLDETIVPYDSGRAPHPNRDIKDDEIYLWLKELTGKTSNVTLVFDCCHSGTITREILDPFGSEIRWIEPDTRPADQLPPSPIPSGLLLDGGRDVGASGWLPLGERFALFAGCTRDEKAFEIEEKKGVRHGALTYFLAQELLKAGPDTTCRDVFEAVAPLVSARYPDQHPQLEGARDMEVFGVRWIEPMKFVPVLKRDGTRVVLGGGATCGMTEGSQWEVFPEGTKTLDSGTEPLGLVSITKVQAVTSEGELLSEACSGTVNRGTRAVEQNRALDTRMPVEVKASSASTWDIESLRDSLSRSTLLRPAGSGEAAQARVYLLTPRVRVGKDTPAPMLGPLREETWAVVGKNGDLLMPPHLRNEPMVVNLLIENLEKRARYGLTLDLANDQSVLNGKVEVELFRVTGGRLEPTEIGPDARPLFYEGDTLGLKVVNKSDRPLFIYVLDLGLTGRIKLVHPSPGTEDTLSPGRTLEIGTLSADGELELYIPNEFPFLSAGPGEREVDGYETVKILATTHPADLYPLFQSGMRSAGPSSRALTGLLEVTFGGGGYRLRDTRNRSSIEGPEDWTALSRSFRLRRRQESRFAAGGGRGI